MEKKSKKAAAPAKGRAAVSTSRASSNGTARSATSSKSRSNGNGADGRSNGSNGRSNGATKNGRTNGSEEKKESLKGSMLQEFFLDELKDLYWAEKHLVKALTKMSKEATTEDLKEAFLDHRAETEDHVSRLEEIFEMLGEKAVAKKCDAIDGITKEVEGIIEETKDDTFTRDVALIIGGQKAEHYEIATYGGLVQIALVLGHDDAAELLLQTLDEEKAADSILTSIAESWVNEQAVAEQE